MTLPAGAMFTGRTAATARGLPLGSLADPVEILCHEDVRAGLRRGVLVRRMRHLPPVEMVDGLPLAPSYRMAYDLAARRELAAGVADVDAVAHYGLVDLDGWRAWLADEHSHDVIAVRAAAELADARAESRPESLVRVALVRAGLEVEPQYVIRAAGTFVARVDLALVRWRVAVEYDGAWHALRSQLERDRARLNAIGAADWRVVHVTAAMLSDERDVVEAVYRARRRVS
jgi:very-short-patch-repair endonuclease